MQNNTQLARRVERLQMLYRAGRRDKMRAAGLWRGQMPILDYVITHDGCTQASLAEALGISTATVAVSTKRLCRAGLMTKSVDPDNLRQNRLSVTEAGRERCRLGAALIDEYNRDLFSALSEREQEELCHLLDKLIERLGETSGDIGPLENFILRNKLVKEEETK